MKRVHLQAAAIAVLGLGLPFLALAQFKGPTSQPPNGNTPGVIWNEASGGTQTGAAINIDGNATVGQSLTANTLNSAANTTNQLFGDNKLQNSKAFRVDQNGSATFNMGNWGGTAPNTAQPLTFTVFGDQKLTHVNVSGNPGTTGSMTADGKVQATQFCFNPGTGPNDCITTWPTASTSSGLYVLKAGDSMTGKLSIYTGGTNLEAGGPFASVGVSSTGALGTGVQATGGNYGVYAVGGAGANQTGVYGSGYYGGNFNGGSVGVYGQTLNPLGTGGQFIGGVQGVTGQASGAGGIFSGSAANSWGVEGLDTGANGIAVKGWTSGSNSTGGAFTGSLYGVNASSSNIAGNFQSFDAYNDGAKLGDTTQDAGVNAAGFYGGVFAGGNTGIWAVASAAAGIGGNFQAAAQGIHVTATNSTGVGASIINAPADTSAVLAGSVYGGSFADTLAGTAAYAANNFAGLYGSDNTPAGNYGVDGFSTNGIGVYGASTNGEAIGFSNSNGYVGYIGTTGCGNGTNGISLNNLSMIGNCTNYNIMSNATNGNLNLSRPTGADIYFRENGGSSVAQMDLASGGDVGIGTNSPDAKLSVNGTVDKPGGGSWGTFSDARLKDIDSNFTLGLDAIDQLNPVVYNYKTDNALGLPSDQKYVGLVAQNVQAAIPQAVTVDKNGYLILNNDPVIMTMLNSIKELQAQNEQMQKEIDQMKVQAK